MNRSGIGELEELILLMVVLLEDDAYALRIKQELKFRCNRVVTVGSVHSVLKRLKGKGLLLSRYDGATPQRGGRRKHIFYLSSNGRAVLLSVKEQREAIWRAIPLFN